MKCANCSLVVKDTKIGTGVLCDERGNIGEISDRRIAYLIKSFAN
jgi:hypothetical protein